MSPMNNIYIYIYYISDYATQSIKKTRNEQNVASFPSKKPDVGITKNYRGITLRGIAAKVYNVFLNRIQLEMEKEIFG